MTIACLSDKQVCRTIGYADDETNLVMRELNNVNAAATFTVSIRSYRGYMLSARCTKETLVRLITKSHSLDWMDLLEKASNHGTKFFSADGYHATIDDFFKSI